MDTETPAPPNDPEIRKIIETLAHYVAKNGAQFEIMVREREKNNAQFFFLRGGDYNKYYMHCLAAEHAKQAVVEPLVSAPLSVPSASSANGIVGTVQAVQQPPAPSQAPVPVVTVPSYPPPPPQRQSGFSQPMAPSVSGSYPQQMPYHSVGPEAQEYGNPPYHFPPPPRFYPPPWAQGGMEGPRPAPDYSHNQQGYGVFPPVRSRFSQGPPPGMPFGGPPRHFGPPPGYVGPPPERTFRPGFPPRAPPFHPAHHYGGEEESYEEVPPERPPPPQRPWYELPAGIMLSFIRTEECSYRSLDPKTMVIPPPQLITEKSMRAIDSFYSPPTPSQPRNAEGWEKLGLYDFYKAKDAAKKALQRGERVKQYHPGRSRSDSPRSRYSSRSRSRSYSSRSRSRSSSRSRSRSRSSYRSRSNSSPSPKRRRKSRSKSRTS